jgi:radical SAM superfamily enzyme YgiQ (UPF0313 family)
MTDRGRRRLYLVNPSNSSISIRRLKANPLNAWFLWKPLGLMHLASLAPFEWEPTILDENIGLPDYGALPRPDLVGITAFTSQACRAYEIASTFRARGIPVVMGGIHASMRVEEALSKVDSVVTLEAEEVWPQVLLDAWDGCLKRVYRGAPVDLAKVPIARHDLLPRGYAIGSIQTSRGCPNRCSFCSVSAFNGKRFRFRPIPNVIEELRQIREKTVLIVDDNLVGTSRAHMARAKDLFRAMIDARSRKKWIAQATINMADDGDLLALAARSGCAGVLIGFETPTAAGLDEVNKRFNVAQNRDLAGACRRIQSHGIAVCGSFMLGLDVDTPGIGRRIAATAADYGVDFMNLTFMTPLPGTRLWEMMESTNRIAAHSYPADWKYYTLKYPVAILRHLSWRQCIEELAECVTAFYSTGMILRRMVDALRRPRWFLNLFIVIVGNVGGRRNLRMDQVTYREYDMSRDRSEKEHAAAGWTRPRREVIQSAASRGSAPRVPPGRSPRHPGGT